jgi:HEAT repeat protein
MVAGEREPLLSAAKSDASPEMRAQAIQLLGAMGAGSQLADLYASESNVEVRSRILQGLQISGNTQKLIEVAKTEKDPKLRSRAIQVLGVIRSPDASSALAEMYAGTTDTESRSQVLRALFVQGNAKQLIEIARTETNPDLKKAAVQHLSHMKNKEATEYLIELLK